MTRFLRASCTPTLLGFDPQMQVVHEDDVVEAVCHAVCREAPGVFNIAAEGVLPLSKLMALAGKLIAPPVFHLAAYWGNPVARGMGLPVNRAWPIELDYLRYPWVADLGRMRNELEFVAAVYLSRGPSGIGRAPPAGEISLRWGRPPPMTKSGCVIPSSAAAGPGNTRPIRYRPGHGDGCGGRRGGLHMSDNDTHPHCTAQTKAGQPCKNYALPDSPFCRVHQGAAVAQVAAAPAAEPSPEELQQQLSQEVDKLIDRVQEATPGYDAAAFLAHGTDQAHRAEPAVPQPGGGTWACWGACAAPSPPTS